MKMDFTASKYSGQGSFNDCLGLKLKQNQFDFER